MNIIKKNNIFFDNRGYNLQIPNQITIKEQFISLSKKNVLRGIHKSRYGKLITVLSGKLIDYIIDFSQEPFTYHKNILSFDGQNQLYIPPNYGHLWISLEDNTMLLYQLEGNFDPLIDININYLDPYINLDINKNDFYIMSEKDINSNFIKPIDYIILGSSGFLGSELIKYLKEQNKNFICLNTRLEQFEDLKKEFILYKPKYIICAAGISGKPTISWCETHEKETFNTNFLYMLNLAKLCDELNIHLTIFGSAIIYKNGINDELKEPDNESCVYTKYRVLLEKSLKIYNNILYLRIQYPIAFNNHPLCFMNKTLTRLKSINDQEINVTFIPELFPKIPLLIEQNVVGVLNFVNPKSINIIELVELYKKYNDNTIIYNTIKIQSTSGLLDTNKLEKYFPDIKDINTALVDFLKKCH